MTQADTHVVVGEREGAASVEAGVRAFPQSVGGSAWRRRQRRLRSMGRFVAQSVRVALATTSHHSFDSRAGGSTVRTVDQRVSELERKLETELVSRSAAVELLVETLQGDMSRGHLHLESSLDARLCDVSVQFDTKVSSFADSCCAISDKFESHVATLTVSCANLDAQVKSLSESCRRYADDVANMSTCVSALDRTTGDLVQQSRKSRSEFRQLSAEFPDDLRPNVDSLVGFGQELSDSLQPFYPMFDRLLDQGCSWRGWWGTASPRHTCSSPLSFAASSPFAQAALWGFCLAEVRSCSVGSAWPRSGRALWVLLGRVHLVLSGVCLAEVRSSSVASPACLVPGTVSSGSRGATGSRPGVVLVFVLSGVCFSSVLRYSFLLQLSTAEVASLSVGRLAHLIVAVLMDSIDMSLGDGVCSSSPTAVFRSWLVAPSSLFCASTVTSVFRSLSRLACPLTCHLLYLCSRFLCL